MRNAVRESRREELVLALSMVFSCMHKHTHTHTQLLHVPDSSVSYPKWSLLTTIQNFEMEILGNWTSFISGSIFPCPVAVQYIASWLVYKPPVTEACSKANVR